MDKMMNKNKHNRGYKWNEGVIMFKKIWMLFLGVLILIAALAGGFITKKARMGNIVAVDYTVRLDDGTVYYTTVGDKPAQFSLGESGLLPAFEKALLGMRTGESKIVRLPFEEAYGSYRPELVTVVSRSEFPEGSQPIVGKAVRTTREDGTPLTRVITQITEDTVILDANNPLAGQNLTFDIELIAIGKSRASASINPRTFGWILLALGVAGFVFFNTRNRRRLLPIRVVTSFRRLSFRRPHR